MGSSGGCKIDRVVGAYGLAGADPRHASIHDGLLARWQGTDGHSAVGYRTLTGWFNRRLLQRACVENGRDIAGGRVDHDYEALTGDDELRRAEVEESLRADGVDADRLLEDMVSWGTVRTHLTGCLDGTKERAGGDWERDAIGMARSFAREKVEGALSSLGAKGDLAGLDRASVTIQVQVQCEACPTRVPLEVALDRGYVCETHSGGTASP